MAITPCGHRVLVRQDKVDEHDIVLKKAREAGLELALDRQTRYQFGVDEGIVVKVNSKSFAFARCNALLRKRVAQFCGVF